MSYLKNLKNLDSVIDRAEKYVTDEYRLDPTLLRSKSRHSDVSEARFAVWYILKEINGLSTPTIAEFYSRHHSTIVYGINKAKNMGLPKELKLGDKSVEKLLSTGDKK